MNENAEENLPINVDVLAAIRRLVAMDINVAKGNPKVGGVHLNQIKVMAAHLGLTKSGGKDKLIDAIIAKMQMRIQLSETLNVQLQNEDGVEGHFRKDKNTFARYVCRTNLILVLCIKYICCFTDY